MKIPKKYEYCCITNIKTLKQLEFLNNIAKNISFDYKKVHERYKTPLSVYMENYNITGFDKSSMVYTPLYKIDIKDFIKECTTGPIKYLLVNL